MAALIRDYRASRWWRDLAPATRRHYGWALEAIEDWAGDMPARAITPPAVQAWHESLRRRVEGTGRHRQVVETPAKAAAALRVLRLVLQVGVRLGYCSSNAAARPGLSVQRQREPVLWRPEQVETWCGWPMPWAGAVWAPPSCLTAGSGSGWRTC